MAIRRDSVGGNEMRMRCGVTCDGNRTAAAVAAVLPSPSGITGLTDETLRAGRCMFVQHVL